MASFVDWAPPSPVAIPGHVVYVTEEDDRGAGLAFLEEAFADPLVPVVLAVGTLVLAAIAVAYLRARPLRQDVAVFRETLVGYRDLLPWLLRLGFGLPLVGAGFGADWFNPIVPPILPGPLARLVQIGLGFAILFGIATRIAALLATLLYLVSVPVAPALLWSPEWIPGLVAIALLGGGRPSADQVLGRIASAERTLYGRIDPVHEVAPRLRRWLAPGRRLVPTIVRIGLGATFVALGTAEKLLAPRMGADVVEQYGLTAVLPIGTEGWILLGGFSEVAIGLVLLAGLFTRFAAISAMGVFVLTLFAIPDDPVLAHVGLFAMCSALLITGSGPYAIDNRIGTTDAGRGSPLA